MFPLEVCKIAKPIGYWLLAIGYWLLAIGYWLSAIGYWLLATGYFPRVQLRLHRHDKCFWNLSQVQSHALLHYIYTNLMTPNKQTHSKTIEKTQKHNLKPKVLKRNAG